MKILVTGGAGFVETNLIKRLLKEGHKCISIDNYNTGLKQNHQKGGVYLKGDIRSFEFPFEVKFNLISIVLQLFFDHLIILEPYFVLQVFFYFLTNHKKHYSFLQLFQALA